MVNYDSLEFLNSILSFPQRVQEQESLDVGFFANSPTLKNIEMEGIIGLAKDHPETGKGVRDGLETIDLAQWLTIKWERTHKYKCCLLEKTSFEA